MKGWDVGGKQVDYRGVAITAYTRGHLAKALNRSQVTIRKLEREGILCHPGLRDGRGWWIYTRDQIEDIVKLAEEEGVLDPRWRKPFSERFSREAKLVLQRKPNQGVQ